MAANSPLQAGQSPRGRVQTDATPGRGTRRPGVHPRTHASPNGGTPTPFHQAVEKPPNRGHLDIDWDRRLLPVGIVATDGVVLGAHVR